MAPLTASLINGNPHLINFNQEGVQHQPTQKTEIDFRKMPTDTLIPVSLLPALYRKCENGKGEYIIDRYIQYVSEPPETRQNEQSERD